MVQLLVEGKAFHFKLTARKCWCGSSSRGLEDQRGFVWFRGPFWGPLASVAVAQLELCHHGDSSGCCYIGRVFRGFFFFFVSNFWKLFCGARAGCAAEETIRATAKPNWFLWVKQKLVVSYYTLRWQGRGAAARTPGENRWLPLPGTISAHIPYWHNCGGFYTASLIQLLELTHTGQLFHTFAKVTADLFFIPIAMTCNWFSEWL